MTLLDKDLFSEILFFKPYQLEERDEVAWHDAIKLPGLLTPDKSILDELPRSTNWLVFHSLYHLNSTATSSATTKAQAVVEVTCYGSLGTITLIA
jgi:hypothetical protein